MSAAGFLEKLLDGAEVEWLPMGDERVGTFTRGGGLQKKDFVESGVGCIHYGQIYTHYGTYTRTTKNFVSKEFAKKARMASPGDIVIATTSENDEDVCKAVAWLGDEKIAVSSDACFYSHKLNAKFVSYFFQTQQFQKQKVPYITGAKIRRVNADSLAKILIPIPCPDDPERSLAIQREIVRILDSFTELTARKKQYNHYRDQLLSFEGVDVEWKSLEEIGEFIRGKRFTKADYAEDGIDVIHYGEIYTRFGVYASNTFSKVNRAMASSLRYAEPNDVILTDVGETVDEVGKAMAWVGENKVAIHDHCYAFRHQMNPKFIAYCMQASDFISKKYKYVAQTKVNTLLIKPFGKAKIPVPFPNDQTKSLEEQKRIATILDNFDTLTTSISEGLPREIELREKQYAYYRDQLLSFPKPGAEAT